ncbi:hypothetical protein AGDE_17153 [Angomonas deanei]|nr:hypothetical protein AGDE_17153 [Angomonas deanei]|eukprot:EPY15343.1 hypothetical protein AGDE_17153 [Angomonas deanei]
MSGLLRVVGVYSSEWPSVSGADHSLVERPAGYVEHHQVRAHARHTVHGPRPVERVVVHAVHGSVHRAHGVHGITAFLAVHAAIGVGGGHRANAIEGSIVHVKTVHTVDAIVAPH